MSTLQLVKSENFGDIRADVYSNGEDMFMTINQLADCLEYLGRDGVEKIIERNPYLKNKEFSVAYRLSATDGKQYNTRVFTEDGIYEVTMISSQPKAKEFRAWIRQVIKGLRRGDIKIVPTRRSLGEVNSAARIITQTLKEAGMSPQFRAVALKSLYEPVGVEIPLEGITLSKRLYDCTAIAKEIGLLSKSGNPHSQAVSAIITCLTIADDERELAPFQNNGHSGTSWQYAESVLQKVADWVRTRNFPKEIVAGGKSYKVFYTNKAAS